MDMAWLIFSLSGLGLLFYIAVKLTDIREILLEIGTEQEKANILAAGTNKHLSRIAEMTEAKR